MDYTQLIEQLRLYPSPTIHRAADAIEALQAKVVELDHDTADLAMLADQYKAERDTLAAKLAALEKQEPVAMGFAPHGVVTDALAITRVDDPEYNVPLYLAAGAQPDTALEYMTGYSDGKQWAEWQMVPLPEPDLFWNDDDPEHPYSSIDEFLNHEICYGHPLEVGHTRTIQRAIRLPNIEIRITAVHDEECEADYEVVEKSQGGGV